MRKPILTGIAGLMLAAPAAGLMLAAPAAGMMTGAPSRGMMPAASTGLVVAMRDPGCHWFYLGGGPNHRNYALSVTQRGPVPLVNLDEAALKIKGPGGTKLERVGAKLTLRAKGVYTITMVGQAPDDKTLKLTIK
jgi:hypothetical protein